MRQIWLDKNEMPYPPPAKVRDAIKETLPNINRYTRQESVEELRSLLAVYNNIEKNSIILRPGSDILIKELMFLFAETRQIIIPDPTFVVIQNASQKMSSSLLKVKLSAPEFHFPSDFIQKEIDEPTLLFLDNPNNPSGQIIIKEKEIESLITNKNVILFVDEAYFEFSNRTVAPLVEKYDNLGVLRTLSKSFGLAGAGLGYLIAGETILQRLRGLEVMLPSPSIIGAITALKKRGYLKTYIEQINQEKIKIVKRLKELGVICYPSSTNFLLMKINVPHFAQKLANHGIYVYDASHYFKSDYIRVTIGTEEENDFFLQILSELHNL
jgi:histidinol-phosphate aminotransferase